jgi:hypothetical protein
LGGIGETSCPNGIGVSEMMVGKLHDNPIRIVIPDITRSIFGFMSPYWEYTLSGRYGGRESGSVGFIVGRFHGQGQYGS